MTTISAGFDPWGVNDLPPLCSRPSARELRQPAPLCFPEGVFVADNWACASMDVVRSREDDGESIANRHDQRLVTLILPSGAFLVLGIYKHRGRTEAAVVIDEAVVRPLTLADVDALAVRGPQRIC